MKIINESKTVLSSKSMNTEVSIYDIEINSLEDKSINLSSFNGKHILFVNVASE